MSGTVGCGLADDARALRTDRDLGAWDYSAGFIADGAGEAAGGLGLEKRCGQNEERGEYGGAQHISCKHLFSF